MHKNKKKARVRMKTVVFGVTLDKGDEAGRLGGGASSKPLYPGLISGN